MLQLMPNWEKWSRQSITPHSFREHNFCDSSARLWRPPNFQHWHRSSRKYYFRKQRLAVLEPSPVTSSPFISLHYSALMARAFSSHFSPRKCMRARKNTTQKKRQPPIFKIKLILPRFDQTSRQKHNTGPVGSCTILQLWVNSNLQKREPTVHRRHIQQ